VKSYGIQCTKVFFRTAVPIFISTINIAKHLAAVITTGGTAPNLTLCLALTALAANVLLLVKTAATKDLGLQGLIEGPEPTSNSVIKTLNVKIFRSLKRRSNQVSTWAID
jgi:hypothetical protein